MTPAIAAVGFLACRFLLAPLSPFTIDLPILLIAAAAVVASALAVSASNQIIARFKADPPVTLTAAGYALAGVAFGFSDTLVIAAGPLLAVVGIVMAATAPSRLRSG